MMCLECRDSSFGIMSSKPMANVLAWDSREILLVSLNGNLLHRVSFWVEFGRGYDK